jgi:hypothetical protein
MANFSAYYKNICTYDFSNPYSSQLWSRYRPPNSTDLGLASTTANGTVITYDKLDERRKCEILKYKKNASNMTKKAQFAAAARGSLLPKRGFAIQTDTVTNPNIAGLTQVGNLFVCPSQNKPCSLTTECDVPGPPISLCYDADVPLYNYVRTYEYKAGEVLTSEIPTVALTAPNNLVLTSGDKQLVATWAVPDKDADGINYGGYALAGYRIAYSTDRSNWTFAPTPTNNPPGVVGLINKYTVTGLTNNVAYYVKVDSINTASPQKMSAFPAISSATTFLVPTKPLNVAAVGDHTVIVVRDQNTGVDVDKTSIIVTWSAPFSDGGTPITGYTIGYSTDRLTWKYQVGIVYTYDSATGIYKSEFSGTFDNPIIAKSTYYIKVAAINLVSSRDGIPSPYSPSVEALTLRAPSSVGNVVITTTPKQKNEISLAWTAPTSNGGGAIQAYTVSYYVSGTTGADRVTTIAGTTAATVTNFTVTGLSKGVSYTILVTAKNKIYSSEDYQISARTNTTPGMMIGLKAAVTAGEIILSFVIDDSGGSAIGSFIVQVSTDNSTWVDYEYVNATNALFGPVIMNLMTTNLVSTGTTLLSGVLKTKTLYYFRVAARNVLYDEVGTLTNYNVSAIIKVVPGPPRITSVIAHTVINQQLGYIVLIWTAPLDLDRGGSELSELTYIIEYSSVVGNDKQWVSYNTASTTISGTTASITNLVVGNNYFFRVYALNTIGRSVPSSEGNVELK